MADNVYLLETRLSSAQQAALEAIRSVARQQGLTVFLVGGAVRDLISGSPVRDLDVVVQGNALTLREQLEQVGAQFSGQTTPSQSLYVRFPNGVRVEVGSTLSATYPKPGKPIYQSATILEDLRRRDFTANAMALSLNEGSYGLLMDPLNGVADIENRELRLVSNYGFIEDPARLIRVARFMARLGWQMDERTRARYETAKEENYIAALQESLRGYEVEELFHEEEPLRVMRRLEAEGWLQHLSPALSVEKANAPELQRLREAQMQLETRGIRADAAAANFPLLTGKIGASEVAALKKSFPRTAFVTEIDSLEAAAKELSAQLLSKAMALPSEAYKLILRSDPVTVLWALHATKSSALQARFKSFINDWPQAQTKIPVLLMTEMRITPDVPGYAELQETLLYALMDGKLTTPEEMKAFLEPYSPPAPPPPISLRRPRTPRKEAKAAKSRKKPLAVEASPEIAAEVPGEMPATMPSQPAASQIPAEKTLQVEPSASSNIRPVSKPQRPAKKSSDRDASSKKPPIAVAASKVPAQKVAKTAAPAKKVLSKPEKSLPVKSSKKAVKQAPVKKAKQKPSASPVQGKKATASKGQKKVPAKVIPAKKAAVKTTSIKKAAPAKKAAVKKTAKRR